MRKLLSADLYRLKKDRTFWFCMLAMSGIGVFEAVMQYIDKVRYGSEEYFLDDTLFVYMILIAICSAIFGSLFCGTDYSDGTIRNKLIVGHTRSAVYCSNWIVHVAALLLMTLAYLIPAVTLGAVLLEPPQASVEVILFFMFIGLFTILAYASVFLMLSMLITKKANAAVIALLVCILLFGLAIVIQGKLEAPEYISAYSLTVDGIEQTEPEPNPKYLQPEARRVYQCLLELLPTGQSMELFIMNPVNPLFMVLSSIAVSVAATLSGIFLFRKKDLK